MNDPLRYRRRSMNLDLISKLSKTLCVQEQAGPDARLFDWKNRMILRKRRGSILITNNADGFDKFNL